MSIHDLELLVGAATFCSVPLAWDSACKTAAGSLPPELQLCSDLSRNDHAPQSVASMEFPHCLDALAGTALLHETTCRLSTREAAQTAAQGVMTRTYPVLTGELTSILPEVLTRISAWWTAASTAAAGDQSWLLGRANLLLDELHARVEAGQVPLPTGDLTSDASAAALLADINGTRYVTDLGTLVLALVDQETGDSHETVLRLDPWSGNVHEVFEWTQGGALIVCGAAQIVALALPKLELGVVFVGTTDGPITHTDPSQRSLSALLGVMDAF